MGEKKVVWFAGALHIYLLTGMGYGCMFISWPARSGALGGGKPIVFMQTILTKLLHSASAQDGAHQLFSCKGHCRPF